MTRIVLQTPRLALREMGMADLDFLAAMLGDPEVTRFYPKRYSREEAIAWVERQVGRYARDGHGLWLVLERQTDEPVGQVGLVLQGVEGRGEIEVGYMIHRPFWRRGFALEAAAACRDYAFEKLNRAGLLSLIRPENLPSQGVARRLGMQPEGRADHAGFEHLVFVVRRPEGSGGQELRGASEESKKNDRGRLRRGGRSAAAVASEGPVPPPGCGKADSAGRR